MRTQSLLLQKSGHCQIFTGTNEFSILTVRSILKNAQNFNQKCIMTKLAEKECVPCKGGVPPLKGTELANLLKQLDKGWQSINGHHLEKEFKFKNFRDALAFTNKVGALAEAQGHHPDIYLAWGRVKITTWTHKIDGLTESDFVLAAKIDRLAQPRSSTDC